MSILFLLMLPQILASQTTNKRPQDSHIRLGTPNFPFGTLCSASRDFHVSGQRILAKYWHFQNEPVASCGHWHWISSTDILPLPGEPFVRLPRITPTHGMALIFYAFVGFGEEFLFRGYLQTRLVAWSGVARGWILAAVVMAWFTFQADCCKGWDCLTHLTVARLSSRSVS